MSYLNILHIFLVFDISLKLLLRAFISVKYKKYNKALSLYFILSFEQFTTFFYEYEQDFSFMLTLYGML